eukprot:m.16617 g.16617  ORF g.16617 m.16617 type:complete len:433 (+) comp5747_c0_seq2:156-1454(+)
MKTKPDRKVVGVGRHAPLGDTLDGSYDARNKKQRGPKAKKLARQEAEDEEFLTSKMSKKILDQAQAQQQEEMFGSAAATGVPKAIKLDDGAYDDEDDGDEILRSGRAEDGQETFDALGIQPEDEATLKMFMPENVKPRHNLADLIMGKIKEKETEIASQMTESALDHTPVDPKVVKVFTSVGKILAGYRSGKLPKAFKILPSLKNWEEVLYITNPDGWSAAAMFAATRIFTSNLNQRMAQRFFNLVLLPRIRDDIAEFKRLNFHLYMSLKKALFKPAAFFKGILIPLCEAGDCTLREAVIVSSVLTRTSVPPLHSSAAMLKIAEMPYTGANSIFLRVLLDKKYALPYRVVDALVFHYYKFRTDNRRLPVLWHQSFLVFAIRYKEDITSEQKEALLEVLRKQKHHTITEEIRRELTLSKCRDGAPLDTSAAMR